MASVIGGRMAVESLFKGVASSRATGRFVQAHGDSITLVENYRAPLEANRAGEFLQLRNSLGEGVGAIFSSVSLFLGVLFEFGLPLLFWAARLFVPGRLAWHHYRHTVTAVPAAE